MSGWIKLHRQILDSLVFQDEKIFRVWIYLLLRANHADTILLLSGKKTAVKRGSLITGRRSLSEAVNIPQTSLERILKFLCEEKMIGQQTSNKNRVISILNYDSYQNLDNKRTTDGQQMDTDKKNKELEEDKKSKPKKYFDFSLWPELPEPELYQEWVAHRRKLKIPINQRVINATGKQITLASQSGFTVSQCLQTAIDSGWKGLQAEWLNNQTGITTNATKQTSSERAAAELEQWARDRCQPEEPDYEGVITGRESGNGMEVYE
jgi:hypothetical protein